MEQDTDILSEPKTKPKYKTVKMKVTENEYTLIQELTGGIKVSSQIRDLFLDLQDFSFKTMPKVNYDLVREITRINNNLNQIVRAVTEAVNYLPEYQIEEAIKYITEIDRKTLDLIVINTSPASEYNTFKSLLATDNDLFTDREKDGPRYKEIKICFTDEQYELLTNKMEEFDGYTPAYIMREYFLLVAIKYNKLMPMVSEATVEQLNKTGYALNSVAKQINERRKAGLSLLMNRVNPQLNRVDEMVIAIYNREVGI